MGQVVLGKRVNPPAKMLTFLPPGYSWELVVEACRSIVQILTLFEKCHFHTRFQTRPLRTHTASEINFQFAYFSFFLTLLELKRCVRTRP